MDLLRESHYTNSVIPSSKYVYVVYSVSCHHASVSKKFCIDIEKKEGTNKKTDVKVKVEKKKWSTMLFECGGIVFVLWKFIIMF